MPVKNSLRSVSTSINFEGRTIDVMTASFCDRDLVVITQCKKLGTLVSVSSGRPKSSALPSFASNVIMGKDEVEYHVYARAVAETVFHLSESTSVQASPTTTGKPLLCTIALTELKPSLLNILCDTIKKSSVWS